MSVAVSKPSVKDILLLNSFYDKDKDRFYYVYKDTKTGIKKHNFVNKPKIPIYKLKPEIEPPEYFKEYEKLENLNKHEVSYKYRIFDIARVNKYDSFAMDLKNKKVKAHDVFLDKTLYGADIDLRDWFLMNYMDSLADTNPDGSKDYKDEVPIRNIHCGYFDIETDIKVSPNREEQPIYMLSYIDAKSNRCLVWNLINPEYNNQEWVMKNEEKFAQRVATNLYNELCTIYPDKNSKEFKIFYEILSNLTYEFYWYTDERQMLIESYQFMMRHAKPDFLYAFNTSYDVSQTEMRAEKLGIHPRDLWCDPEFDSDYVWMNYKDQTFKPSKRRHNFESASSVKILDMMISFYAIRSLKDFPTYNLSDTAQRVTGFKKVDYGHICGHISELPYADYAYCLEYNIRDTLLLYLIDVITDDTTALLTKKFIARTEFDRMLVPMSSVSNVWFHMCRRKDQILSNDINKYLHKIEGDVVDYLKDADEELYEIIMSLYAGGDVSGGLCTEPNKFIGEGMEVIPGMVNHKVVEDTGDEDAASMYPNNIITGNITKSTLVGKITNLNDSTNESEIIDFTLALINRDAISIGVYFGLPNAEQIYEGILGLGPVYPKKKEAPKYVIPMNTKDKNTLFKILSSIDTTKLNGKDREAGDYQTTKSFVISKEEYSRISMMNTCVSYKLRNNSLFEVMEIPEDIDFAYIKNKKDPIENDNYIEYVKPKNILNVNELQVLRTGILDKTEVHNVANEYYLTSRLNLGDGLFIDGHSKLIAILDSDVDIKYTVYTDPLADWLFFVRLEHEIPLTIRGATDYLELMQDLRVIKY